MKLYTENDEIREIISSSDDIFWNFWGIQAFLFIIKSMIFVVLKNVSVLIEVVEQNMLQIVPSFIKDKNYSRKILVYITFNHHWILLAKKNFPSFLL